MTDVDIEMAPASTSGYASNPNWSDVQPVLVDDGGKVVSIQYTEPHAEALSYFRAVLASNELSKRVLKLTADMIKYNQADYTAWQIRWRCVDALGVDLQEEFAFTRSIMLDNAKNYQLWNHRRKCALKAGASHAADELAFAREALDVDEKNYHAWAHRQAIVRAFNLWDAELQYVEVMIGRDVRNNSAWNQRAWIVQHSAAGATASSGGSSSTVGVPSPSSSSLGTDLDALLQREMEYTAAQIQRAPRNESSWNYLRGLFGMEPWRSQRLLLACTLAVHTICVEALHDCPSTPHALDLLAEYYLGSMQLAAERLRARATRQAELQAQAQEEMAVLHVEQEEDVRMFHQACANIEGLLEELFTADPMRSMYWQHRMQEAQLLSQCVQAWEQQQLILQSQGQ